MRNIWDPVGRFFGGSRLMQLVSRQGLAAESAASGTIGLARLANVPPCALLALASALIANRRL